MFEKTQITDTYQVDGDLRKQLETLRNAGRVKNLQSQPVEFTDDQSAQQTLCEATFAGETVIQFVTVSPLGIFSSYQRNQEMAAAMILTESLQYGEPTLVYEDHATVRQHESDYLDLTAEWYYDPFVEKGLPEKKMELRPDMLEAKEITLETLEYRAKRWFESH